jgi:hypothetical protein
MAWQSKEHSLPSLLLRANDLRFRAENRRKEIPQ